MPVRLEATILVDPARSGGAFAAGLMTLPPGGALPMHRLLGCEEVLFVHKGQGRAVVEGRSMTVVPGTSMYVPRQAWQSLRNTGTGLLQVAWVASPPGLQQLFRELAHLPAGADAAAIGAVLARHGVELMPEGQAPPVVEAPRRHSRRRHRGRGPRPQPMGQPQPASAVVPPSAPAASSPPPAAAGAGPRRRRRRRGGHGRGAGQPPAAPARPAPASPPAAAQPGPKKPGRRSGREHHRRGHVKEVYMGGKWVRVVGEGPVIAQGSSPQGEGSEDQ